MNRDELSATELQRLGKEEMSSFDIDHARLRREILKKYRSDDSVRQVLFVSHTTGWQAIAMFYEKQKKNNAWSLTLETSANIGKNGVGKTKEGDTRTPCGELRIIGAFGILPDPGTSLHYIDVKPTTFACDEDCEYYNQIIDIKETGHDCKGEEMWSFSPEYNYGLITDFNEERIPFAGSAIFVHCKGMQPFTAGCIAFDEKDMKTILMAAEEGMRVYVDEYYIQEEK